MTNWREIPVDTINWWLVTNSRVAGALWRMSTDHSWRGENLGKIADVGERVWIREPGLGPVAVEAIKELIDRAAAGEDVTIKERGNIVPYTPRPWPRTT